MTTEWYVSNVVIIIITTIIIIIIIYLTYNNVFNNYIYI